MAIISVIDYGMGNIHSVAKALQKVSDRKDKIYITSSLKETIYFRSHPIVGDISLIW